MTASGQEVTIFWRPGCGFCMALERQLADSDLTIHFRNIWEDHEAAEFVRAHAQGNEIVPTVQVGETVMVNPTAGDVLSVANKTDS
ncbi:MAG TPA: NrdH-redoxin [Acidimicrobiaceae bacterium]|nr:NrdH-redoxin [Acidimicrobiaceae bacterium]